MDLSVNYSIENLENMSTYVKTNDIFWDQNEILK